MSQLDIIVSLKGIVWRRIRVEVSPDEYGDNLPESIPSPQLSGFGLPTPEDLLCVSLQHQIAEKVHAAARLHNPPAYINDRARDVIDLLLLKALVETTGVPTGKEITSAIEQIFQTCARDAALIGRIPVIWPTEITSLPHWEASYEKAAASVGMDIRMEEAVGLVNSWLKRLSDENSDY